MNKLNYEQVLNRMATYCSHTERCVFDVRRKMDEWEISSTQQNQIIQHLKKERFIDEERYCRAFVNDKSKYNKWGINKIKYELSRKGIPEPLILETIENFDADESRERLRIMIEHKIKTVKGKNEWEIRQKLIRFAASKGFSFEDIEITLESITFANIKKNID